MARRGRADDLVRRDWGLAARSDAEYWRRWKERHGVAEALRLSDELRRQACASRPDWPSEADRRADLAAHARVSDALRRVSRRSR